MATTQAGPFTGRTAWVRSIAAPVREFLATETGSAAALLSATVLALLWANSAWWHSYESVWTTRLAITIGHSGLSGSLRQWVNDGLMTFFFLVAGLEAKRELDMGELRERRRLALPVFAALGGMSAAVAVYLAFNAGGPAAHGWGAAMSTDTAFALGVLALVAPRGATRLRVFLLTLAIVDDLVALLVITTVYSAHVDVVAGDESLFTLRTSGDKLSGRGAYDMKFAIAAYMQLVDELQGTLNAYDFSIMITTDEEYGGRDHEKDLFQNCRNHQRPVALRIPRDDQKCNLPRDRHTDEAIEKLRMRDWRRRVTADPRFEKVLRQHDDQSVDTGDKKDIPREFHWPTLLTFPIQVNFDGCFLLRVRSMKSL